MNEQSLYQRQIETQCFFNNSYSLSEEEELINNRIAEITKQLKSYGITYNNDYESLSLIKNGEFFDYSQDQKIESLYLELDELLNGD